MSVTVEPATEWVQLDPYGVVLGGAFTGTGAELAAHLLSGLPEGSVAEPAVTRVYVHDVGAAVEGPLLVLRTPWTHQRWIPRPVPPPVHRAAWLFRL